MKKTITDSQARKFFAHHLGPTLPHRDQVILRCPFHDDQNASLSVNLADGVWCCQAGCGKGGMIDFEVKISNCDTDTAKSNIASIVGADLFHSSAFDKPEAVYQYRDANGVVVFEKLRYPGKRFQQRHSTGNGRHVYNLQGVTKLLYNLPELVTANVAIIVEGEKDADNVTRALAALGDAALKGSRIAVTTNFDGAGKWLEHYSPYFAGKKVVILPDHDDAGSKHADRVARAVHPYAAGVRVVNLPGLDEHGDVSDYLQQHSAQDLIAEITKAKAWFPPKAEQTFDISAPQFANTVTENIDWMIDGVLERGSNGMIAAAPKSGKSWTMLDMAIALALGEPWLGFRIPRPVRVMFISREDNPNLTAWRFKNLWRGRKARNPQLIETNLHFNTRAQSPQLLLDNEEQLEEMMTALHAFKPEFVIFDVFNVLHCADENDNSQMREVLRRLTRVQTEVKCGIGLVHHFNKNETGSITQRVRGASVISGWCEWNIGLSMADERTQTRKMEFELKAATPPEPVLFRVVTTDTTRLEREGDVVNMLLRDYPVTTSRLN
jgi:5S rRNA maturation endonuclease (ribonuclease M5)